MCYVSEMAKKAAAVVERCALCGCAVHRSGRYATEDSEGRSHATQHHYVAERFFGRSSNRKGTQKTPIFPTCPWGLEGRSDVYCYECHELVLHNPVLLPDDVAAFGRLIRERSLDEQVKGDSLQKVAGRVELFHEVIVAGLKVLTSAGE